ncbi:MAG: hypothetical protein ACKVP0_07540 [Pirellulaceae bacterium]
MRLTCCFLGIVACLFGGSSAFGQEPAKPEPPKPAVTAETKISEADLAKIVEKVREVVKQEVGSQLKELNLEQRITELQAEVRRKTLPPPPAPGGAPEKFTDATQPPAAAADPNDPKDVPAEEKSDTVISPTLWTIESAKDLGIYQFEPAILEATQVLAKYMKQGESKVEGTAAKELKNLPTQLRDEFLKELETTSRTETNLNAWKNFWNQWKKELLPSVKGKTTLEYKATLVRAFKESELDATRWGRLIEDAHQEATKGAGEGGAAGGNSSGGGSSSGYSGYRPHHHAPIIPFTLRSRIWHTGRLKADMQRMNYGY